MKQAHIKINKGHAGTLSEEHISFEVGDRVYSGFVSYTEVNGDFLKVTVIDDVSENIVAIKLPNMYSFSKGGTPLTMIVPREMVVY